MSDKNAFFCCHGNYTLLSGLEKSSISEVNFNILFYQSPEPMLIFDTGSLQILEVNDAAINFYGYSKEEFLQLSTRDLRVSEEREDFDLLVPQFKSGKKVYAETRHQTKSGDTRYVDIVSYIIEYFGKPCRIGQIHDVSSKVKQAENLRVLLSVSESISGDRDLDSVLQKVTDATTQLSGAQFGAFFYNSTTEKGEKMFLYTLSGAPKEAFEHFGIPRGTAIFHPTLGDAQTIRLDDVTTDSRYGKNPPHSGLPKGHLPVRSYLAVPVISKSKQVLGSLFFGHQEVGVFSYEAEKLVQAVSVQAAIAIENASLFQEVSSANSMKESLLNQAREQNFKKDEFLSVASHELKTPVTSMKGYLQLLQKQAEKIESPIFLDLISKANSQVNKIVHLVSELLNFSKLESGKMVYNFSHFAIGEALDDCIEAVNAIKKGHKIKTFGELDCILYADKVRIEQVIVNLIDNAIKYSPDSDEVLIGLSKKQGVFTFEIRDFGNGIEPDKIPYIFERYYRGEENSYKSSGLGLGLFISSEIIKSHHGKMGVSSEVGKGSTFWFSIPLNPN